jgi:hypothetical protein
METAEKTEVYRDFKVAVNMAPATIEKWLDTDDSKRVGWKGSDGEDSGESVGYKSGRHIVAIKTQEKG